MQLRIQPRPRGDVESGVTAPQQPTVEHDHRAVLYTPDGKAMVRVAGFAVRKPDEHTS